MKAKLQNKLANTLPKRLNDFQQELANTKDKEKVYKKIYTFAESLSIKMEHTPIAIEALKLIPSSYPNRDIFLASILLQHSLHNWKKMSIEEGDIKSLFETDYNKFIADVFENMRTAHKLNNDSEEIRRVLGIYYYEIGNRFGFRVITKFKAFKSSTLNSDINQKPMHSITTYIQAFNLYPSKVDLKDEDNLKQARSNYQTSLSITSNLKKDSKFNSDEVTKNLNEVEKGLKWIADHKAKTSEEKTVSIIPSSPSVAPLAVTATLTPLAYTVIDTPNISPRITNTPASNVLRAQVHSATAVCNTQNK